MTTIPIEVIVQDAEAPIVPSEDGTNTNTNTEATVAVPDTGNGAGSIFTGSASSIILPATLLVLAIGSIVAILIHKYHKQKKDKISKKEKLAVTVSSTIAVLAATVLVSNLILPATKAATSDVTDGITPVEDKVSIVVTRDSSSAEASTESTATITSTGDFGYTVLLSMAEGVEAANLYLDGDETSEYYIAPVEVDDEEGAELTDNTWGYALTEDSEYSAVPLVDNAAIIAQGDEVVEDESLSIYYGVMVSSDLPAGTYSGGEVEYSLTSVKPIDTISYLQDFATMPAEFKATVLNSMVEDQQYYLKDNRDNKTYRIAKLKDGNVWMTQNLDLQKEGLLEGISLDNSNTDSPANNFALPTSQISNGPRWADSSFTSESIYAPHVYDTAANGETYKYCLNFPGYCAEYGDDIPEGELGNLYNWYTATAGTGTKSVDAATGSICPAGWRLPTGSGVGEINDYSNLLYLYGILESSTSSNYNSDKLLSMFDAPLSLVPAGFYNGAPGGAPSGWVDMVGASGNIMYSSAPNKVRSLMLGATHINPWYGNGTSGREKYDGESVRCLVR